MIRLLFDDYDYGDAHMDIILKVDTMPTFSLIADTYFLGDFLGGKQTTREQVVLDYLEYFKIKIQKLANLETFVVFDLTDQYVGGFFFKRGKKDLIKTQYSWTDRIEGWRVSQDTIYEEIKETRKDFRCDREWLLSADSVLQGLDWSINRIKNARI